jgi:hypothetical protein
MIYHPLEFNPREVCRELNSRAGEQPISKSYPKDKDSMLTAPSIRLPQLLLSYHSDLLP